MLLLDVSCPFQILEKKDGVFGGSIRIRQNGRELVVKKSEARSAIQKAIRSQNAEGAIQAAVIYAHMAQGNKTSCSWLFNRLPVIAKEDCATSYGAFKAALQLYQKYQKKDHVKLSEVISVIRYMCSCGTSRLPSHMRALHGAADISAEQDPVNQIVTKLQQVLSAGRDQVNPETVGDITSFAGAIDNAKGLYSALLQLLGRRRSTLGSEHLEACKALICFTQQRFGNQVNIKSRSGHSKRSSDHDMMLRECVRYIAWPPADASAPPAELPPPGDLTEMDFARPFAERVFDLHVDRGLKTLEGEQYFALISSATTNVLFTEHQKYDQQAHAAYLRKKGVASEEIIQEALAYARGEAEHLPDIQHPRHRGASSSAPESAGNDADQGKESSAAPAKRAKRLPTLGTYELLSYVDDHGRPRYSLSSFRGTKAPTVRTTNGHFIKLFRTAEKANFAVWAYQVLAKLGLPAAAHARVEFLRIDADVFDEITDEKQSKQQISWISNYVGPNIPAMVCEALGSEPSSFRRIDEDDLRDSAVMEQFVKVLIVRRAVIRSSDLCTNNIRIWQGKVYSVDHNLQDASKAVEFVANRFTPKMQRQIRTELKTNRSQYFEFANHCKTLFPDDYDASFSL